MYNSHITALASWLDGDIHQDNSTGEIFIRVDTGDNTSKENYDDLLCMRCDMDNIIHPHKITEMWADHDTQIITITLTHL